MFPTLGHEHKWRAPGSNDAAALFRIAPAMASSDMDFVRELALAGGGIAALPSVSVGPDLERGSLVRVLAALDLPKASLYLVHRSARVLAPKVRAFREFVVEALGARRPAVASRRRGHA
jgi:DNA-binding transcriptional LysR family regulator